MISFVIPTKNEEKVIEKTLWFLKSYSGDKEIIVSDGGSTDETVPIARRYTEYITVHEGTKRQTIAGGRNAGAALAHGEFLVFLDADMYVPEPDPFFQKALEIFEKRKNLVAMNVSIRVFPEDATVADRVIFGIVNAVYLVLNNFLRIGAASGEFQMIRTEAFKRLGGYNELLPVTEDQDMFRRLAKIGRTRFERSLTIYHTGRRAHAIGWPRLLYSWFKNGLSVMFFKRSADKEWKEIR